MVIQRRRKKKRKEGQHIVTIVLWYTAACIRIVLRVWKMSVWKTVTYVALERLCVSERIHDSGVCCVCVCIDWEKKEKPKITMKNSSSSCSTSSCIYTARINEDNGVTLTSRFPSFLWAISFRIAAEITATSQLKRNVFFVAAINESIIVLSSSSSSSSTSSSLIHPERSEKSTTFRIYCERVRQSIEWTDVICMSICFLLRIFQ